VLTALLLLAATAQAETRQGLGIDRDTLVRAQGFVALTGLQEGSFNPRNTLARLSDTEWNFELRPDVSLSYASLDLSLKPRLRYVHESGESAGEEFSRDRSSTFINEGHIRVGLSERLFFSYGREVLLWGPALFVSPSNPFFVENGQSNPYRELGGRDYLKGTAHWNDSLTFSLIHNTGLGRDVLIDQSSFRRTSAAKVDYVGTQASGSLILSQQQDGPERVGAYLQWTLSDALIGYAETGFTFGSEAVYPRRSERAPGGWAFDRVAAQEDTTALSLAGLSYTFASGPTVAVEYAYNEAGYSDAQAKDYYALADELAPAFLTGGARAAPAAAALAQARSPRMPLLRRNYLFAQGMRTNVLDQLDLTLRYTHNLDDGGSTLVPIAEWNVNDYLRLFALGFFAFGGEHTEFSRFVDRQFLTGVNITF
jgi:hypothetical protein